MVKIRLISKSASIESKKVKTYNTLSIERLTRKLAKKNFVHPNRIRLSYVDATGSEAPLYPRESLDSFFSEAELEEPIEVIARDSGPQISAQKARSWLNLSVLFIHCFDIFGRFWVSKKLPSQVQTALFAMIVVHLLKKQCEPASVDRFSYRTVPIASFLWELIRSWGFFGMFLCKRIYGDDLTLTPLFGDEIGAEVITKFSTPTYVLLITLWGMVEYLGYRISRVPVDSEEEKHDAQMAPKGHGSGVVTCPQYLCETISWMLFFLLSGDPVLLHFMVELFYKLLSSSIEQNRFYSRLDREDTRNARTAAMIPFAKPVEKLLQARGCYYFFQFTILMNSLKSISMWLSVFARTIRALEDVA